MQRVSLWLLVVVSLMAIAATLARPAMAQTTGGRIVGRVTDPSGAVVPKAAVTLINEQTAQARTSETNQTGDYIFIEVPVGTYRMEIQATGFAKSVRTGIVLQVNQTLTLNVALQMGAGHEEVEVTTEAPLVDSSSTQLGAVIGERAVVNLPLNARDTYQLLQLQPGVQGTGGSDLFYGSSQSGAVSVNGGRGRSNNFSVNGGDGNDLFVNSPAIQPSPDSIAEFRVISNTFDAEYGRNSGAVVNVVTKSGSNTFHGSMYEFFRNKALNAASYVDPFKPDNKGNQFGGTIGGPIKKDRTFFFGSYEGRRVIQGVTSDPVVVPTAAEQTGNFSSAPFTGTLTDNTVAQVLNNRPGCAAQIPVLNPGAAPVAAGTPWSSIFTANQIPTQCFDPVAANLMQQFVPQPGKVAPIFQNIPGAFQAVPDDRLRQDQFTIRLDHKISDSQSLNIYYYFADVTDNQPFTRFQALTPNLLPGFGNDNATRNQQVNISHTWTISTNTINEFRFTYFRESQGTFIRPQRINAVTASCTGAAAAYCFTGTTDTPGVILPDPSLGITPGASLVSHQGVPFIDIFGGFTIGNDYEGELPQTGNTFQWGDNLSKIVGSHALKFGADYRRQQFNQTLYFDLNGDYTYSGGGANDLLAMRADGTQNLFPNYLLGLPDSYLQGSANSENVRSSSIYLFAQDSWKIKPNLTLNYGLRWELNIPMYDIGNRVQTFRAGQATTTYPCALDPANPLVGVFGSTDCSPTGPANAVFPLGLVVPGDAGVQRGLTATYYKGFAPRIGLAWSPDFDNKLTGGPGHTVIRMGYGLFYNPIEQLVLEQFQAEPPFGGSSLISEGLFMTPFVAQSCPAPCGVGSVGVSPNPFGGILSPPPGTPIDWSRFRPILLFGELQPNMRMQYSEQYNFGIQRQIGSNMMLQIGYVGSQGHRLLATHDINFGNAQTCLDLNATLGAGTCGPFFADSSFFIPPGTTIAPQGLHLPYGNTSFVPGGTVVGPAGITLVGLRPYSSPYCQPMTGVGCAPDGIPTFSSIFAQDVIASSNYNSLQVSFQRQMSKGLQFLAAYTWSKSIDNASTFENILNPLNLAANRTLSLFDARHRFVISYLWELPVPKYNGGKGKVLNGWAVSGITAFQAGFPIRMQSNADAELMNSFDFELPGKPNITPPFVTMDPRTNNGFYFNTGQFSVPDPTAPGATPISLLGNTPRALCCGPGIDNFDIAIHKVTPVSERVNTEFRAEFFNAFNHTQFLNPDGNISDGLYFGRVLHTRDPRIIQLVMKLSF